MSFTFGEIKPYLARDMKLSVKMLSGVVVGMAKVRMSKSVKF